MGLFKKTYTVSSKDFPDSKLVNLLVDLDGRKYVSVLLPDGKSVDIYWYKVTNITYRGWFMRFIYRKAKRELPDLRDKFLEEMKLLSGQVKYNREMQREQKIFKSKKRYNLYMKKQFKNIEKKYNGKRQKTV